MDSSIPNAAGNQSTFKVSISARLIPALIYTVPAIGGAVSSFLLMLNLRALRRSENVGLETITRFLADSIIPVLGSLYFGSICGLFVIAVLAVRMATQTKTASPRSWFFIICGVLFLVPAVLFAEAQSQMLEVLINLRHSMGLSATGANLGWLLISSLVTALISFLVFIVISVIPLSSRVKPRWSPLFFALLIEVLLIAVTIAFQLRYSWLHKFIAEGR